MSIIPEGYELISEGMCSIGPGASYPGLWYHNKEDDIYYFLLSEEEEDEEEVEDYRLVEDEDIQYRDDGCNVHGWFSKTMEEYIPVDILGYWDDSE